MENIFKIENISLLNEVFGQEQSKHPLISIIDFTKVDFKSLAKSNQQRVTTAFYSIILKKLNKGSVKYGRWHLDFQQGSLFFTAPNQMVTIESPELSECKYNWGIFFHANLLSGTTLYHKIADYKFFNYGVNEALHVSENEKQSLTDILDSLQKEINRPIDKHTKKSIVIQFRIDTQSL